MPEASSLGYPVADYYNLSRTNEGIVSNEEPSGFIALCNYPVKVAFSNRAIRKVDQEYVENDNASTINVFANLKSNKKLQLFSINTNFFGIVQMFRNNAEMEVFTVPVFPFNAEDRSFSTSYSQPRSFSINGKNEPLTKDDIVISFGAEYLLGYNLCVSETHDFAVTFFKKEEFPNEEIILHLDVTADDTWDLNLFQRG